MSLLLSSVSGIFLFGSTARGDPDDSSDVDVLVVYESPLPPGLRAELQQAIFALFGERVAVAEYSVARVQEMFDDGHLFAWHLFKEATPIVVPGWTTNTNFVFNRPQLYRDGQKDAERFVGLMKSISLELHVDPGSLIYEAGLIYLSLRNIAMSLSFEELGTPDFSRFSPYNLSTRLRLPFPTSRPNYAKLIAARHASQRGHAAPTISKCELLDIAASSIEWSQHLLRRSK